jgi:predicted small secreted protein
MIMQMRARTWLVLGALATAAMLLAACPAA